MADYNSMYSGRFVWPRWDATCLHGEWGTEDGGFAGIIQADYDDFNLFFAPQLRKHLSEKIPHHRSPSD